MGQRKSKLSEEDISYLETHTQYGKREILQWYRGFKSDCPNRILTETTLRKIYSTFYPNNTANDFCHHVFRSFNTDGSGNVDFRQFLMAVNATSRTVNPVVKLDWAFRLYDVDQDGLVNKENMELILQSMYDALEVNQYQPDTEPIKERVDKIFAIMDRDRSGAINRQEFIHGCLSDKAVYRLLTTDPGDTLDSFKKAVLSAGTDDSDDKVKAKKQDKLATAVLAKTF